MHRASSYPRSSSGNYPIIYICNLKNLTFYRSHLMPIQENHPFRYGLAFPINTRPRLLTEAIGAIVTLRGLTKWFHQYDNSLLGIGAIITILIIIQWLRDVTREETYQGVHTKIVTKGLRWLFSKQIHPLPHTAWKYAVG